MDNRPRDIKPVGRKSCVADFERERNVTHLEALDDGIRASRAVRADAKSHALTGRYRAPFTRVDLGRDGSLAHPLASIQGRSGVAVEKESCPLVSQEDPTVRR
jgi:hypothetical protein